MENVESLCIFNDEAHNTKAEQYNDLINKLSPNDSFVCIPQQHRTGWMAFIRTVR
jgi:hypothetical protein